MKAFFTGLLLIGMLLGGCEREKTPPGLIEEQVYIDLLVELQLLKSYRQSIPADSSQIDSLKNSIYARYQVTEEQFRMSHNFYQEDPEEQKRRVDMAIEQLRMDQVESDSTRPWLRNE